MKRLFLPVLFTLIVLGSPAMAVEEPAYTTLLHANDFELRQYPALVVAEVTVTGDRTAAASKGFRLLAGYIFGGNTRRQSIPMTAPVVETRSQTIAMTAPVLQTKAGDRWVIRFVMPSRYTLGELPTPNSPEVHLTTAPPARVAVIRFSGLINKTVMHEKTEALDAFIRTQKLRAVGTPSLAQYDPPWTLWFLRRNEIMIPVDPAG